jgi:hypothetical protein
VKLSAFDELVLRFDLDALTDDDVRFLLVVLGDRLATINADQGSATDDRI